MLVQTLAHEGNQARPSVWRRSSQASTPQVRRDARWRSLVPRQGVGQVFQHLVWGDCPARWTNKELSRGRSDESGNRVEACEVTRFIFRVALAVRNETAAVSVGKAARQARSAPQAGAGGAWRRTIIARR